MADPPVPTASTLLPALRNGVRAAEAWTAHALTDLSWDDAARPTDELRAQVHSAWQATLLSAAQPLADALGWGEHAEAVQAVLAEAHWGTAERLRPVLDAVRHQVLRDRLLAAARPFGVTDPLEELSARTGRTGALARDLLAAHDRDEIVLSAEAWHELCWVTGAALRVISARTAEPTAEEDARLRDAVAERLAGHDEAAGVSALARRLARRLAPDRLMPGEALLAGHTHLAAALLAERIGMPAERLSDWLLAPDPMPFAVALRAGGEGAPGVGGLLAALAGARGQPVSALTDRIAELHSLSVEAAGGLLEEWA